MRRTPGGLWVPDDAGRVTPPSVRGYRSPALRTGTRRAFGGAPGSAVAPLLWFSDHQTQPVASGDPPTSTDDQKCDKIGAAPRKWETQHGAGILVIAAAGLGFPAGMLRCLQVDDNATFDFLRTTALGVPSVGDILWYRWYQRFVQQHSSWVSHPVQDGGTAGVGDYNWLWTPRSTDASTWTCGWRVGGTSAYPLQNHDAPAGSLQKGHTYRFEMSLEVLTTSTCRLHAWVYNEAGNQVLGDVDFKREDSGGSQSLANNPTLVLTNINHLTGLNAGCNGSGQNLGDYARQGGFAHRRNAGPIGQWPVAQEAA